MPLPNWMKNLEFAVFVFWTAVAIADGLRRWLWVQAVGVDASAANILLITAGRVLPWLGYTLAVLIVARAKPILYTASRRSIGIHGLLGLTLILLHPAILSAVAYGLDIPGARTSRLELLYLDVLISYLPLDGLLVVAATLGMIALGYRSTATRLAEQPDGDLQRLHVRRSGEELVIPIEEIEWIAAAGNYVEVHTDRGSHLLRGNIGQLERKLDSARFLRTHRSVIANMRRARALRQVPGGWRLELDQGRAVPVSRRRLAEVREQLSSVATATAAADT